MTDRPTVGRLIERRTDMYWIIDPGHGWLAVPLDTYPDALDHGTGYGYASPKWAYLEEDCEAGSFLRAHPEINPRSIPEDILPGMWAGRQMGRIPDARKALSHSGTGE